MFHKIWIALILFSGVTEVVQNTTLSSFLESYKNLNVSLNWHDLKVMYQNEFDSTFSQSALLELNEMLDNVNVSSNCSDSLTQLYFDLREAKSWAVLMADASGKFPSGFLTWTLMDLGSFDECLNIRFNDSSMSFSGQYCMVGYSSPLLSPFSANSSSEKKYIDSYGDPPEWIAKDVIMNAGISIKHAALWLGTCIPSTCSQQDLMKLLVQLTKPLGIKVSIADCQIQQTKPWPTSASVAVCFFIVVACLCILGIVADNITIHQNLESYVAVRFLKAFSIYRNTEELLGHAPDARTLGCFHGIRFLSATWIILGHTYFIPDNWQYLKHRNLKRFTEIFNHNLPVAVIENFTIPVGSFFFMSGFLLVYTIWRKLEKNDGNFNLIMFLVRKYLRLTPALGLIILMVFALPLIDTGPLWYSIINPEVHACETFWWTNILYVNNLWESKSTCAFHTWYLAALMQFHLIGVVVLLICYRWKVMGTFVGLIIPVGSCILTSFIAAWHNFPMPALGYVKDMEFADDYLKKLYIKPFNHIATYFIGMLTAHLVLKYKDKKLETHYQILGWILAVVSSLSSIYGLYGPSESLFVRSFYIGFHRVGWASAVGWVAYSCIAGNGGIINRFLSWKAFIPLGHLSFLAYLIHPLVMIYRNASLRERVYYGQTELVFKYLVYTLVSFFLAFIGYITVEKPFATLERLMSKTDSSETTKNAYKYKLLR